MRRVFLTAAVLCPLFVAVPASAQVANATTPSQGRVSIGAIAGAAAVQHISAMAGGEIAFDVTSRVSLIGEGLWMQDVVTRRRLELAELVATFVSGTQGATVTSDVTAPAVYGGAGFRVMLMSERRIRPYVTISAGVARIALKPTFALAGSDISSNLAQYGVTLGSDLTGETTKAAVSAGLGLRMNRGLWYVDGGLRVTSIRTPGQPTNAIGASIGFGRRF